MRLLAAQRANLAAKKQCNKTTKITSNTHHFNPAFENTMQAYEMAKGTLVYVPCVDFVEIESLLQKNTSIFTLFT